MPIRSQVPSFRRLYYRFNLYAMICQNKLLLATQYHLTTFINGTYRVFPVSSRCLREDPVEVLLFDLLELVERLVVVLREDDVVAALSSFSTSSISLSFKSVDAGLFFTDSELTFPLQVRFRSTESLTCVKMLAQSLCDEVLNFSASLVTLSLSILSSTASALMFTPFVSLAVF